MAKEQKMVANVFKSGTSWYYRIEEVGEPKHLFNEMGPFSSKKSATNSAKYAGYETK